MSKVELFVAIALGQISVIIAMLKRQKQTPKIQKWIKGLKAASAGLSEIIEPDVEETPNDLTSAMVSGQRIE